MATFQHSQDYWTKALGDVSSGRRTDFTKLPTYQGLGDWLTPQRKAYYDARNSALENYTSTADEDYGETKTRVKGGLAQQFQLNDMAKAAGLNGYSMNPMEADYLGANYNTPHYGGTGSFLEKVLSKAPTIAAGAFGTAGALGGLDAFAAGGTSSLPESYWSMTADAGAASDAAPAAAGTFSDGAVMAPSTGTGVTPAGAGWVNSPAVDGSSLFDGLSNLGAKDYLKFAGNLAPGILGYFGANKQADAYKDVASQNSAIGAPYRSRLEASYGPNFDLFSQPMYSQALDRAADVATRKWSAQGNPAGNPTLQANIYQDVLSGLTLPALSNYRGQLMQAGGMGLNTSGLAQLGGAQNAGSDLDAIGLGLGRALNPQPTIEDILKQVNGINGPLIIGGLPQR